MARDQTRAEEDRDRGRDRGRDTSPEARLCWGCFGNFRQSGLPTRATRRVPVLGLGAFPEFQPQPLQALLHVRCGQCAGRFRNLILPTVSQLSAFCAYGALPIPTLALEEVCVLYNYAMFRYLLPIIYLWSQMLRNHAQNLICIYYLFFISYAEC